MFRSSSNREKNKLFKKKTNIHNLKEDQIEFVKNNKLILKTQQRFKSERHNVFTEETSKIVLTLNDHKLMQSADLMETYPYGTSKYILCNREKIKGNYIIKQ